MSASTFRVVYDGPALAENQMDVRDLAPALMALGDALEQSHNLLRQDSSTVRLKVRASFKAGSFGIELEVVQNFLDHVVDMFSGRSATAATNLLALLGFTGTSAVGLVQLIKWLKGRSIRRVMSLDDDRVEIQVDDDSLEVDRRVVELYRDWRVRKALEDAIRGPLKEEGIESFGASSDPEHDFVSVDRSEAYLFEAPPPADEELSDSEEVMNLQLATVAFRDDNKWRFSDGASTFHASVSDEGFLHRINSGEAFAKGDVLRARVRKRQWLSGETIRADYDVREVLEHRRAHAQLDLPIQPDGSDE